MTASEGRRWILFKRIKIGFIGAGKVGVSLGKYLKEKGRKVEGYYSLSRESAMWAAKFTKTTQYCTLQEIISSCDMIFFTVPDGEIASVWEEVRPFANGKIICHCSGLHSSKIFSSIGTEKNYAYSIHPLMAVSSKESSWKELSDALFTIEGDATYLSQIEHMFLDMGNRIKIISADNKIKYHAAAALSSNYMTALFAMSQELFLECGFDEYEARQELFRLANGNLNHILEDGCVQALTGPVERGDDRTVLGHIGALPNDMKRAYLANASYLLKLAQKKHPARDYSGLKQILSGNEESEVTYEKYRSDITETERE